jgi:KUP system potassium uptake protein
MLMVVTLGLTIFFGSSDRLASAFGIAVSMTMLLTTMLMFAVMRRVWKWNFLLAASIAGVFFCIDASFLAANLLKVLEGGWVPLALAAGIYGLMTIWHLGTERLVAETQSLAMPIDYFRGYLVSSQIARVPGTAVFLTRSTADTPPIVIWHVPHNRALHQHVVALTLLVQPVPWTPTDQRVAVQLLMPGFWQVTAKYGFMDTIDIPALVQQLKMQGCDIDPADVTYYVGHETILHNPKDSLLAAWQVGLYAFMHRNCVQISEYLSLPRDNVLELGRQIEI